MTKCRGCGIVLQENKADMLGYTTNINSCLCLRCFRLRNYSEYSKVSLDNKDFYKIINNIGDNDLVLYVTDILSLELDFIEKFSNVIVVVTKRDIMPKKFSDSKLISYIKNKYNVIDVMVVSSIRNYNLDMLYNKVSKLKYNDIYLVGNTNSGKSTLLNKLVERYGKLDDRVTVSMYPSTTLDIVRVELDKFSIIDTPGIIGECNIVNILNKSDLKLVIPKREIRPKSCQVSGRGSILLGNYVRLDYEVKGSSSFVIYVSNLVGVRFCNYEKNTYREYSKSSYLVSRNKDIVIPGLGFIKFMGDFSIDLYMLEGVSARVRESYI